MDVESTEELDVVVDRDVDDETVDELEVGICVGETDVELDELVLATTALLVEREELLDTLLLTDDELGESLYI